MALPHDERVASAAAHWAPRIVSNGTDYFDFQRTVARISRWEDWCEQWGRTAHDYETLATVAEDAGHEVTAREAWRRAGLCWHWAKFVFEVDQDQRRAAGERAVGCYARGAAALSPPAERVLIPYSATTLPAYLRVPAQRAPVVVMVPGLDSVKEELQATADFFSARGLATLAIDGPGQGEREEELAIEPAYEKVVTAALDFLETRGDVDSSRSGIFGVSLGGYYAARAMAYEPRLRAGIMLGGPFRLDLDWDTLPPLTREVFAHRSRSPDDEDARAAAALFNLEDAAPRITRPMLVVHGAQDRIFGRVHADRLGAQAPGAELLVFDDGNHGVANRAFQARSASADWLALRL